VKCRNKTGVAKKEELEYNCSESENRNQIHFIQEESVMAQVTKDTLIGEAIRIDEGIVPILMGAGMHCIGCPASQGESLAEAAMVHGIDADSLVNAVNEYLAAKEQ
jgi:hybrid cluster-associated redox disulfide protein